MKIRFDFVTNSSSSSFICEICGLPNDYDYSYSVEEGGAFVCENNHFICYECVSRSDYINCDLSYDSPAYADSRNMTVKKEHCPICNMQQVSYLDKYKYLYIMHDKDDVDQEIKSLFKTYDDFKQYLKQFNKPWHE